MICAIGVAKSVLVLVALFSQAAPTSLYEIDDGTASCASESEGGPVFVDALCVDPTYGNATIDSKSPYSVNGLEFQRVEGHFEATPINFTIYLPSPEVFKSRFFQNVYPLPIVPVETDELISFGAKSGGYTVRVQGTLGYRHEAAAAKYSRLVAAEYYGVETDSIYGYIYGGSGGSYQTIGALENTVDVWQGAVPYIQAVPTSIPLGQFSNAFGALLLQDKRDEIIDALRPGGSGDVYDSLNSLESAAMDEMISLGFPPRGWEQLNYTWAAEGVVGFWRTVQSFDPTYSDDFWSLDGYLGTERSELGDLFRFLRSTRQLDILDPQLNGTDVLSFTVSNVSGLDFSLSGTAPAFSIRTPDDSSTSALILGDLDAASGVFTVTGSYNQSIPDGSKLEVDNSWFVASHALHRYQIPNRPDYFTFDQFRQGDLPDSAPIYPQRPIEVGPLITRSSGGGGTQTGKIRFKNIMVQNLLDVNSHPWNAEWYRRQVVRELGTDKGLFRLYFNDNADHFEVGTTANNAYAPNILSYQPILYQALQDLAAWAEKGIEPPRNTQYTVEDSQIVIPYEASERGGIQPVVHLCVGGDKKRAEVQSGEPVIFRAVAKVPTPQGCIVQVDWDYKGTGNWQSSTIETAEKDKEVFGNYTYNEPGTYFPAIRVGSSRGCQLGEKLMILPNLDRVRVAVV